MTLTFTDHKSDGFLQNILGKGENAGKHNVS